MMTIKQISKLSGFSTSTVSKALNNRGDINVETKKQIKDIALENNYIPNKNAIALRKRKTNIIAVILPHVKGYQYSNTLYEIQKIAAASGFRILLFQSFENHNIEKEFIEEIKDGSVDAAIIISTNKITDTNDMSSMPIEYVLNFKSQTKDELLFISSIRIKSLIERI